MNKLRTLYILVFALSALALGACASMAPLPAAMKTMDTKLGKVLTDSKGMTLYTFAKDAPGKSNCKGKCAKAWPPFMAGAGAKASGKFSIITRDDGSKQWAYNNQPLYGWVKDKNPGDTTGHNVRDVWFVVKP